MDQVKICRQIPSVALKWYIYQKVWIVGWSLKDWWLVATDKRTNHDLLLWSFLKVRSCFRFLFPGIIYVYICLHMVSLLLLFIIIIIWLGIRFVVCCIACNFKIQLNRFEQQVSVILRKFELSIYEAIYEKKRYAGLG